MKNMIMIIVSAILGVLALMIVMTINGRMNRSMELKSSLSSAVEETVENMARWGNYKISNVNEYIADFTASLSDSLDADSGIAVEVEQADMEKGLLSLHVTGTFLHPNGKTGTVECDRTVIFNTTGETEGAVYTVRFYLTKTEMDAGETCYKECQVREGDVLTAPANPQKTGERFAGWRDVNGYLADFSLPVTQDLVYYGHWN